MILRKKRIIFDKNIYSGAHFRQLYELHSVNARKLCKTTIFINFMKMMPTNTSIFDS